MTASADLRRLRKEFGELVAAHDRGRSLTDLDTYSNRPVDFLRDVLGADPWSAQEDVARSVQNHRRTLVQSAHAVGKDWLAARLALWWTYAKGGLVIVSGPTERQVREIVFGEVRKAWTRKEDLPGELYSLSLRIPGRPGMLGFTATSDSAFTGFHDPNLLVILTEAQGLEDWTFQAAAACATGEGSRILAVGNPLEPSGPFFRASQVGRWSRFKISAFEHPNVVEGREIIPGAVTREWVEEMADDYGRESNTYRSRVLAEFPDGSDEGLVRRSWIDDAFNRAPSLTGPPVVSVDPSRAGKDSTVLAVRRGSTVSELIDVPSGDLMETTGHVVRELTRIGIVPRRRSTPFQDPGRNAYGRVVVDEVGVGGGLLDRLKEQGYATEGFNGGRSPKDGERFANLRAEAYWTLRAKLEAGALTLPRDEALAEELLATRWTTNSAGRTILEPKTSIRARIGRSPDRADAVSMVVERVTSGSIGGVIVDL